MRGKKTLIIFLLVLTFGAFLRLYKISDIPPGINRDEGAIGYTAYSLLKTGKDEYGRAFPISFESFGDWKLPLYIYITVGTVALFGLNEFAVRLPSVLFGSFTIISVYFLVKELLRKWDEEDKQAHFQKSTIIALLVSLLLAISPWHLHLSRVESESNSAAFFVTLATILFLKSIRGRSVLIIPSLILFSLTYYTYAGNVIFTTVLLVGLIILFGKKIPRSKSTVIGTFLFVVLTGFIFYHTLFGATTKLSGISIFGDPAVVLANIELPRVDHGDPHSFVSRLFHNRVIFALEHFAHNYLNSFSPQFLFIKGGGNKAHNIENFGNMYLIEVPFLLVGFFFLFNRKKSREEKLILWWILAAPIASSITKDAPHTNRMFAIFPMLPLVVVLGIAQSSEWLNTALRSKKLRNIATSIVVLLFILNFVLYLDRYYIHFPRQESEYWGAGYKKLLGFLGEQKYSSKKIVMTHPEYSHYIYLLFYTRYDPDTYQKTAMRYSPTEDGFVHVKSYDRFMFRDIDWEKDIKRPNLLLISFPKEVPGFVKEGDYEIHRIILANGKTMFKIIESHE